MTDNLVKRLREDQPVTQDWASTMKCGLMDEAANRIEALTAKCESLGQQVNMVKYGQPDFAWSIHKAAMADLQSENVRLREMVQASVNFMNGDLTVSEWNEICMRPWKTPARKGEGE